MKKSTYIIDKPLSHITSTKIWKPLTTNNIKNKKRRTESNINEYVSGTEVKNYLLKDPCLDWYELYYTTKGIQNKKISKQMKKKLEQDVNNEKQKLNILFDRGMEFEKKVLDELKHNFDNEYIQINTEGRSGTTNLNYIKTVDAMKAGISIISQGVLIDDKRKIRGTADLIVRSDCLNKLVSRPVITPTNEIYKAPKLSGNYHYRVIDIKWTSMILCSNGYTIRNGDRFPCYKGQLAIYNSIIGEIQGYIPNETYILSKSWKIDKVNNNKKGFNCFDLLGVIDYEGFDEQYIEKTKNAINWVREVRKYGFEWNPVQPTRNEMYPNLSNKFDSPWTKVKKEISNELGEITQIWYTSVQNRENAHKQGVMSWKDKRCTSKLLGINGDKKPNTIDLILEVNRDSKVKIIPEIIENNLFNWQIKSPIDFYVDFETITTCLYETNVDIKNCKTESDMVFMIGVGYEQKGKWNYKVFTSNVFTIAEEYRIFSEFSKFIKEKTKELNPKNDFVPRLFHWSPAEIRNLEHVNIRHNNEWKDLDNPLTAIWTDMCSVFTNEPIVVKGALNFKLKEIGRAMYKLRYIRTLWKEDGPSDGFDAMISAIQYYKEKDNNTLNVQTKKIFDEIIKYNEVDCKVIWEIVKYLRENNCKPDMFEYPDLK